MYAAVYLPLFSLQAVLRWREELWTRAAALVDPETSCVRERTLAAAARDIVPGMSASQAMARCPGLCVLARSLEQEAIVTNVLHETALAHSPFVEASAPGSAVLDWRGLHQQIGWHTLGDQLVRDLWTVGLRAHVGVARTPDVARLAAREADPVSVIRDSSAYLHPLSVAFLQPPAETLAVLHDWGVATIGDFLRLPKAESIERLGAAAQDMWRIASGRSHRPLRLITPPETYAECHDFEHPVETTAPLLFLLRRFADQLSLRLRARHLVAARMTLRLPLDDQSEPERIFSIPEPTSDPDVLFRILSTHLEHLTLPQQPVGVRLTIEPARPTRQQFGLFGATLRDPNRFGETLARLGALVGSGAVGFPELADTHKPDSHRLIPNAAWAIEDAPSADGAGRIGLPLQRWRPPAPADVEILRHCPVRVQSSALRGRIAEAQGPYRLSGNWWEPGAWETEEWDIAMTDGGLYRIARTKTGWQVEGCYDAVC